YSRIKASLTDDNRSEPISHDTAEALSGEPRLASVSSFESLNGGEFQHFSNYALKLNVNHPLKLAPLNFGNLYHSVLEHVTRKLGYTFRHDDDHIGSIIETAIDEEAAAIQYGIFNESFYNASLKRRAKDALERLIHFMRDIERLGEYRISRVEMSFG